MPNQGGSGERRSSDSYDLNPILGTPEIEVPLQECHLNATGTDWTSLHSGAVLTQTDEYRFYHEPREIHPFGLALWPSAIALAHEVAMRANAFERTRVLELGAGTGLPGIAAASLGADVVQTDNHKVALSLCQQNGRRNGVVDQIEYRLASWGAWDDDTEYDWILGSDILYNRDQHPNLHRIFETNLRHGGTILLSDPFRHTSIEFLELLEGEGWSITMNRWTLGDDDLVRPVGVFELRL